MRIFRFDGEVSVPIVAHGSRFRIGPLTGDGAAVRVQVPIIDLDVVVPTVEDVRPVIERLRSIGYRWRGDLGVTGREAFAPPDPDRPPRHHLYLVVDGNRAHQDHVLLRDDPDVRARYAELKRANAVRAGDDIDVYVAAKAGLVAELLTRARAERGLPAVTYWDPWREGDPDGGPEGGAP